MAEGKPPYGDIHPMRVSVVCLADYRVVQRFLNNSDNDKMTVKL